MNTWQAKQACQLMTELMKKHGIEPTAQNMVEVIKRGRGIREGDTRALTDVEILAIAAQAC